MRSPLKLLLAIGAVGAGVFYLSKAAAKPGDKLQVGDDAFVKVGPGGVDPTGLPAALTAGQLSQIVVHVDSLDATTISGMISGTVQAGAPNFVPLATPVGPVQVVRSAVSSVMRNGQTVAT